MIARHLDGADSVAQAAVSVRRRLSCLARGGHRWATITDTSGSITSCGRCGTMRHRGSFSGDSFLRSHTNLGYELDRRETHRAEALEDERL